MPRGSFSGVERETGCPEGVLRKREDRVFIGSYEGVEREERVPRGSHEGVDRN